LIDPEITPSMSGGKVPGMFLQSLQRVACVAACLSSVACMSYPDRTHRAFDDFQAGQLSRAQQIYEDPQTTGSPFLTGAEAGTVALAAGNWDGAIKDFSAAADFVKEIEDSALISPESLGEALVTLTISESVQTYRGEGYERVLLHAGLATAYLAKGDLEGAGVEVRRANALLESEEKLYQKEYKAGGLGHLMSAIFYELAGEYDDAWIDYDRMRSKGVGTELAERALVRLSRRTHRESDVSQEVAAKVDSEEPEGSASVVIVAGIGIGPYKQPIIIPIPTPSGLLQWSVPSYTSRPQPVTGLELSVPGGDRTVQTVVVEDIETVSRENLQDRIAWLVAKSTVRAFLKRELTRKLEDEMGLFGRVLGDAFTFVTERADLRCWQTLPNSWQAARAFLPAGTHELHLKALGGEEQSLGTFELESGETMFVIARTIGPKLYVHPIGGKVISSGSTTPPTTAPTSTPTPTSTPEPTPAAATP
jgi:hypothetical protein